MGKYEKLLQKILLGTSDNNVKFVELRQLLIKLGFTERIKGDHQIFTKNNVAEIINIQLKKNKAKADRVKQIRNIIVKYRLGDNNVD